MRNVARPADLEPVTPPRKPDGDVAPKSRALRSASEFHDVILPDNDDAMRVLNILENIAAAAKHRT